MTDDIFKTIQDVSDDVLLDDDSGLDDSEEEVVVGVGGVDGDVEDELDDDGDAVVEDPYDDEDDF